MKNLLAEDHTILLEGLTALLAPGFGVVATAGDGSGLTVSPFSAFQAPNGNTIRHRNQNVHISHVTVTKAGAQAFDAAVAGGGTQITIHYQ